MRRRLERKSIDKKRKEEGEALNLEAKLFKRSELPEKYIAKILFG